MIQDFESCSQSCIVTFDHLTKQVNIISESYYEDFTHAQTLKNEAEKTEFYRNMKSGAESGWDYSTKW